MINIANAQTCTSLLVFVSEYETGLFNISMIYALGGDTQFSVVDFVYGYIVHGKGCQ